MENVIICDSRTKKEHKIAWRSNIGKRDYQQDSMLIMSDERKQLIVVCDGMGGLEGGAVASKTAIEIFAQQYECLGDYRDNGWLKESVVKADNSVYRLKNDDGNLLKAGTTVAALYVVDEEVYWVSVGDSRIYIFRGDEMVQVTSDHNYFYELNQKYEEGSISREQYREEAREGEALISYLGMGGLNLVDMNEEPFQCLKDDILLICSDGLYKTVPDDVIYEIIMKNDDISEMAKWMEQYIKETDYGWQDNYTFALIKMG